MFYTVYKITNKLNGKFYIGKHQTNNLDDGYMGSGKYLRSAIKKHGEHNFSKEILGIYATEAEMNQAEKDLVVLDESISYNLCPGGQGGFGYINKDSRYKESKKYGKKKSAEIMFQRYGPDWPSIIGKLGFEARRKKYPTLSYDTAKRGHEEGWFTFKGRKHTEETLIKLKQVHKDIHAGEKNSQYGTCWVHNNEHNKKIKKEQLDKYLSLGYTKGRKMELHR